MNEIVHKGIIRKKDKNNLEVEIVDGAECSSCSLNGACNIAETRDKILQIQVEDSSFKSDEQVSVHLSAQTAFSALFWAYLFPFIIILVSVVVLSNYFSEAVAGVSSLIFLLVYYGLIYLNKKYFNTKFKLEIRKI